MTPIVRKSDLLNRAATHDQRAEFQRALAERHDGAGNKSEAATCRANEATERALAKKFRDQANNVGQIGGQSAAG